MRVSTLMRAPCAFDEVMKRHAAPVAGSDVGHGDGAISDLVVPDDREHRIAAVPSIANAGTERTVVCDASAQAR